MNGLREKFRKHEGFTLVEMLIVVAIIAILIAISIPLINNALERAKHATDAANERAAKAEILICYLSDTGTVVTTGQTWFYDAAKGKIQAGAPGTGYGKHGDHKDQVIAVHIDADDEVLIAWVDASYSGSVNFTAANLCSAAAGVSH